LLRKLFCEGDAIARKTLRSFNCMNPVSGSEGITRAFNRSGDSIVWRAEFTDRTQAIILTHVP